MLVAEVSSSISRAEAPASTASIREAAWEVEPEALVVEKARVSAPEGRPVRKGEMSTPVTARPSSARSAAAVARVITHSRPSPDPVRVHALRERAQHRGLAVITAAHDHGDPVRHAHPAHAPAARQIEPDPQRVGADEGDGAVRERQVRVPGSARQDRAVSHEGHEASRGELVAQRLLVAVEGDVLAQRVVVQARVEQRRLGEAREVLGEQTGRLAAADPAPGGGQRDREPRFDALRREGDVGALEHLLARGTGADPLPQLRGGAGDGAGQEVRGRDAASVIGEQILRQVGVGPIDDDPHQGRRGVGVDLHVIDHETAHAQVVAAPQLLVDAVAATSRSR